MKALLIILTILIASNTYSDVVSVQDYKKGQYRGYRLGSDQCTDIDIRDKASPEIKEHYTQAIDQGNIGWCYGYSASDLLSFEVGKPLSPTHVSSIYNKNIRSNLLWKTGYNIYRLFLDKEVYEGGFTNRAARVAMEESPICAYSDRDYSSQYVSLLGMIKEKVKIKELPNEEACQLIESILPNLDTSSTSFMEDFIKNDLNDQLEGMMRQTCQTLIEVPKKKAQVIYPPILPTKNGKRKFAEKLNAILNQGKPLSVAYNVGHITEKAKGFHASTVIGRRWKNGRCEYNIRNSWGRTCSLYKPEIECNQDDGSYWMKDEDFFNMSLNFTHL